MPASKYITALCLLLFFSCAPRKNTYQPTNNKSAQIRWIEGTWTMQTSKGILYEHWLRGYKGWSGKSTYVTTSGDTMYTESVRLTEENGILWYNPTVSNQNAGQEIQFKETYFSADSIVFENPQHDFPQRIIYVRKGPEAFRAYAEGTEDGKLNREIFEFKKQ